MDPGQMEQLRADITQIRFILEGDEGNGIPGLAKHIKVMRDELILTEQKVKRLEILVDRGKYFLIGGVIMGGYGTYELIQNIISHVP